MRQIQQTTPLVSAGGAFELVALEGLEKGQQVMISYSGMLSVPNLDSYAHQHDTLPLGEIDSEPAAKEGSL